MKKLKICPHCSSCHYIIIEEKIMFVHNGNVLTAMATRMTDAFYEITEGIYAGNWVHIWDLIKN